MAKIKALNAGCGNDYRESTDEIEWINADNGNCKKDWTLDIERTPFVRGSDAVVAGFPMMAIKGVESDYFDRIDAIQVMEHISKENFVNVIRELYRISKDGAIWNISVPHALSDNFATDPTHKMPFTQRTFDYFIDGTDLRENGKIYGWGDISLQHVNGSREMDGVQSIHFHLRAVKTTTPKE